MSKYGHNVSNFDPYTRDPLNIDRQSLDLIPEKSSVLEIGCATGFMGDYLIKQKKCRVVGVELGKEEAAAAKKVLHDVIEGDIEQAETIKKINGAYDVVYASALLEHLKDPWVALRTWKKFLKKNGTLIVTTSNIAHWSQRIKMIRGDFTYQKYGLLDNTHLRFFTTHTFPKLVEESGYDIEIFSIDPVGGGLPKISKLLSSFFPNLFAYQMLIKAGQRHD
jgi:2-polyprenyl-3-methyl-5-hydroxy-6-metoxy-1,4-benzoquinol methylase